MTEALLRSIRRWLITIALLLSLLLVYQTFGTPDPEAVDAMISLFAAVVALVSALWLWHSFRGGAGTDTAQESASSGEH
ncbi:hypothetical protein [Haloarchaeobius baliensis]|uniref:hypothetical protein n=1 Tax=Haloarchaeobius baliensis TaxID=1670458 RepID=UPI003F885E8E